MKPYLKKPVVASCLAGLFLLLQSGVARADGFEDGVAAYDKGDYVQAMKVWRSLADQGNGDAQQAIGLLYDLGYGVEQSFSTAADWYRKSAQGGNKIGQFRLGFTYEFGFDRSSENLREAANWYAKAGEQGLLAAQIRVADMYFDGEGIGKNYELASAMLSKVKNDESGYVAYLECRLSYGQNNQVNALNRCRTPDSSETEQFRAETTRIPSTLTRAQLEHIVETMEQLGEKKYASYARYYAAIAMRRPSVSKISGNFLQYRVLMDPRGEARIAVRAKYVSGPSSGLLSRSANETIESYISRPESKQYSSPWVPFSKSPFIVDENALPVMFDGGCDLVSIDFDAARGIELPAWCNG